MAGEINTIWSSNFGSADVVPPIPDAIADGGTQPFLQAVYVAELNLHGDDAQAERAQLQLAASLEAVSREVGRQAITDKFDELDHELTWLDS